MASRAATRRANRRSEASYFLVPTLCVGTYAWTLCVSECFLRDAERPSLGSHAERGNQNHWTHPLVNGRSPAGFIIVEDSVRFGRIDRMKTQRSLLLLPPLMAAALAAITLVP